MGQISSTEADGHRGGHGTGTAVSLPEGAVVENLAKADVIHQFHGACKAVLRPLEAAAIATKVNSTTLDEKTGLTPSDLAFLLQLADTADDVGSSDSGLVRSIRIIYDSCKVMESFPFISETAFDSAHSLTLDGIIAAAAFHSGRYRAIVRWEYHHCKLLYVSLCGARLLEYVTDKRMSSSEQFPQGDRGNEKAVVVGGGAVRVAVTSEPESDPLYKRIIWNRLESITNLDGVDVEDVPLCARDLHQLVTLLLVSASVTKAQRLKMHTVLRTLLATEWASFESAALCLLKYLNLGLETANLQRTFFSYEDVFENEFTVVAQLLKEGLGGLFKNGLLSALYEQSQASQLPQTLETRKNRFVDSKLLTSSSMAVVTTVLKSLRSEVQITKHNLIKLYIGREAGFSIRSLESKIFKWQAPTLLMVSGKRLKSKTASTNKRYVQFDSEYPRFFRSSESHLKSWQSNNDRVTYAVLVTPPWRTSNKKNFGDGNCVILSLSPHLDFFTSSNRGESIYFNTLGSGLGFGNDQPINKNGVKKYLPGDVSLTIEPNLEFAVFRHVSSARGSLYFNRSKQPSLQSSDFEDRFMITDLEVWGIGSTKELEQQQKQWEWEKKQAEARQGVNLDRLKEDRAFMEMVGLVGNYGAGGSV
ncbi:Restriction of telomere capping protein 5 [Yamadazyma tenuis]|uniref:Restriction of telomere capping protein 5 n=1 Tax=Candida tenuis TaxID=2315449 RepID=UPI0027A04FCD|nr:Restriction of telomere capping protein 5 [Yamadazyma tenuis]